jgi:hypothetical protein
MIQQFCLDAQEQMDQLVKKHHGLACEPVGLLAPRRPGTMSDESGRCPSGLTCRRQRAGSVCRISSLLLEALGRPELPR